MGWKQWLYHRLVNEVGGIRERYQALKRKKTPFVVLWCSVLLMNFQYHVLRRRKIASVSWAETSVSLKAGECESAATQQMSQEELVSSLSEYDVISFDVFDTLLLRPFRAPTDTFFLLEKRLEYPGLKELRQKAEQNVRCKENHYEVTLEEIWEELERISGICGQIGMRTELAIEYEICYANPYFLPVIAKLAEKGKRLVVCSDMYLGRTHIEGILRKCGYTGFENCFVSCDLRRSKADGSLYMALRNHYGKEKTYIHVGDNAASDVKMARKQHISAILYNNVNEQGEPYRAKELSPLLGSSYSGIVNARLHNGAVKESALYEFGFIYGGLLTVGYCEFIHDYAVKNGIEKLLFFSRDGDIIQKVYTLLYPEEAGRCEYVYWSRNAAVRLSAPYYKEQFMCAMLDYKAELGYDMKSIFQTMELDDMLGRFVEESGGKYSEQTTLNKEAAEAVRGFLYLHWDEVLEHYRRETAIAGEYYGQKLWGAHSAACIDVGWIGTGFLSLRYLMKHVWGFDCELTGLLLGTAGALSQCGEYSETELSARRLVSYAFSPAHNRDIWRLHDDVKGHNLLIELLFSSPTPPFRGFSEQGLRYGRRMETVDSGEIQRGILEFAALFQKHPCSKIQISGRDAIAPVSMLYRREDFVRELIKRSGISAEVV